MHIINIQVRNKIAVNPMQDSYVCGNSDYEVHFDFDAEWDAYETKTACFVYGGEYQNVVFTGTECKVPIIKNVCVFEVGVFAGNLCTTTPASVPASKSILCGVGVPAGTRINWHGTIKRAAVDLWDTETNNPDNAPTLWEDIAYREGYRVIPETITAGTAFAKDELGWWGDVLYKSLIDANVYTPEAYPAGWEAV